MTRTRIFLVAAIIALLFTPASLGESSPRPGPYRLAASLKGFESFLEFQFDFKGALDRFLKNRTGDVPISGVLRAKPNSVEPGVAVKRIGEIDLDGQFTWIDVVEHRFATAKLSRRAGDLFYTVTFDTQIVANVSYSFRGQFTELRKVDGMYSKLTGVLTRFKDGHKFAKAKVNLVEWTFE